tara:strand:+ start:279 stop:650 length:372 start_codon:yes stop_codon:yes gene_type:complete
MLKHNIQDRGVLSYVEFDDLPFRPKRTMIMYNVPAGESRGHHAHKKDRHLLICVNGRIKVTLTGNDWVKTSILKPGDSILQEVYVWGEQEYLDEDTVMVVLCSENFDETEYIHDIREIIGTIQ